MERLLYKLQTQARLCDSLTVIITSEDKIAEQEKLMQLKRDGRILEYSVCSYFGETHWKCTLTKKGVEENVWIPTQPADPSTQSTPPGMDKKAIIRALKKIAIAIGIFIFVGIFLVLLLINGLRSEEQKWEDSYKGLYEEYRDFHGWP